MSNSLFPIRVNDKYGFIDIRGKIVIDPEFDGASSFSHGLARIFVGNKVGFIDAYGNIKIEPRFDSAVNFENKRLLWFYQ